MYYNAMPVKQKVLFLSICIVRQLCQIYRLDAGGIVCEWLAFSTNKKNARINCEMLDTMEREVN